MKKTLIPAIIQDIQTLEVLMLGYMDKEALERTKKSKKVWFYSRSKKRLWMKGETSGNILKVKKIFLDCDQDTLLILVEPKGAACHRNTQTCFSRRKKSVLSTHLLEKLYRLIAERKNKRPKKSYTSKLFDAGLQKICDKVEEESIEVIHSAKSESHKRLIEESVDLIYHLFVLLNEKSVRFSELLREFERRKH